MVYRAQLQPEQKALVLLLKHERNYSQRKIAAIAKVSKSSVNDIIQKSKGMGRKVLNKTTPRGRPHLLTERDKRGLKRSVRKLRENDANFTVMELVQESGIDLTRASYRTFVRYVKRLGYGFYNARKKGMLMTNDLKIRKKFAREMLKKPDNYWTSEIAFYLDALSFVYKRNPLSDAVKPKGRIWRKKNEGLQMTTKGSKELAGGKRLHLVVVICMGRGVICAEPYEKMSGSYFAQFIRRKFPVLFETAGKGPNDTRKFVMDNCPCQTSGIAMRALRSVKATMQSIPARSPDLNPIENAFHIVRRKLDAEVKRKKISHEKWDEFVDRVKRNIWSVDKEYIDKTIASMSRRIKLVHQGNGHRIKY